MLNHRLIDVRTYAHMYVLRTQLRKKYLDTIKDA